MLNSCVFPSGQRLSLAHLSVHPSGSRLLAENRQSFWIVGLQEACRAGLTSADAFLGRLSRSFSRKSHGVVCHCSVTEPSMCQVLRWGLRPLTSCFKPFSTLLACNFSTPHRTSLKCPDPGNRHLIKMWGVFIAPQVPSSSFSPALCPLTICFLSLISLF